MALSEFELIREYFSQCLAQRSDVELGIGDDAALVNLPSGHSLAMSLDTLVAGVHFPLQTTAEDIGYKALAVNLSDMAAMGAEPNWLLLGLTLPEVDEVWLQGFCRGLAALATPHQVSLIGGDTTHGPLTISVQVNGIVPHGQALKRSGAQSGDLVFVTGSLGDAGLGLRLVLDGKDLGLSQAQQDYFVSRLNRPTPRVKAGLALRGLATAAIDISDGLLADLGHLLTASGVGADIYIEKLPVIAALKGLSEHWWQLPLTAGDDYELCFTAPASLHDEIISRLLVLGCSCVCIGQIGDQKGLRVFDQNKPIDCRELKGYLHFD